MIAKRIFGKIVMLLLSWWCADYFDPVLAQSLKELEIRYASETNDTAKAKIAFRLGEQYWFDRRVTEAIIYLKLTTELCAKAKFRENEVNAWHLLGNAYYKQEKFTLAIEALDRSLELAISYRDDKFPPLIDYSFATIYKILGDYPRAAEYAIRSIKGIKESPYQDVRSQIGYSYALLGNLMQAQKRDSLAMQYYEEGYRAIEQVDQDQAQNMLLNLANLKFKMKQYQEARQLALKILDQDTLQCQSDDDMYAFLILAEICRTEGKNTESLRYMKAAADYTRNKNLDLDHDAIISKTIGFKIELGQWEEAAKMLSMLESRSMQKGAAPEGPEYYRLKYRIEQARGNYKDAVRYQQKYLAAKDSLWSLEQARTVNKMEILYRVGEHEKKIKELKSVAQLEKTKRNRNYIIASLLLIGLTSTVLLSYRNSKIKQNYFQVQMSNLKAQNQVISMQSMINGQETERARIARELHDGLGGLLSATKMHFLSLLDQVPEIKQTETAQKCLLLLDNSAKDLRGIAHSMMPEILMQRGLIKAVEAYCEQLNGSKIVQFEFLHYGFDKMLKPNVEVMIYRILQELMNNILKHSRASHAIIQITKTENTLQITVEDDGIGFKMEEGKNEAGSGLSGIRQRIDFLKGNLSIDSRDGVGTTVYMEFVLDESRNSENI